MKKIKQNDIFKEIKNLLLSKNTPKCDIENYLIKACKNGCIKSVELILKDRRANPAINNNQPIELATEMGHIDIIKILMENERVCPEFESNKLIRQAAKYGDLNIVKILLTSENVEPSDYSNYATICSFFNKHYEISLLLFKYESVRIKLKENQPDTYSELIKMEIQRKISCFT